MPTPFSIIDVFSRRPFAGNPVAIVLAPDESDETMQAMAGWTSLPETVFVTRPRDPRADYAVRIFSPLRELAFAGHPSLGTCHLLIERGLVRPVGGRVTQECPAGLFDLSVEGEGEDRTIAFTVPIKVVVPLDAAETAAVPEALGARPARAFTVEAGARWIVAAFGDPASLGAMAPDQARVRRLSVATRTFGISVHAPSPDPDATIEVRSFGPLIGVDEDAVCGSGNACVAAAIAHREGSSTPVSYTASQGRHRGRQGRVQVRASWAAGTVSVGGAAVTSATGTLNHDGPCPAAVDDPAAFLRRAVR
jgi:PhzF family phenazine biosynthesis protein